MMQWYSNQTNGECADARQIRLINVLEIINITIVFTYVYIL